MMKRMLMSVGLAAGMLTGCGPNVGWLVRPVSGGRELTETVIARDAGLFVVDKIAVVDVDGVLHNSRRESLLSTRENPVSLFAEKVARAEADPAVRAVVLRINSPGGSVTASDIMHQRLKSLRRSRKVPVVAIIEDVGASGAYYVACGAEAILAHPTSLTGSIGVLVQTVSFAGSMKMLGIDAKAVTSGPRKDMISPLKPLDEQDLAIITKVVDELFERFVSVVAESRTKLSRREIRRLADGRIYSASQAKANGLIDGVGYLAEAIALAKKRAGVKRAKVVMYHRPWGYRPHAYAETPAGPPQFNLVNVSAGDLTGLTTPRFLYLWTGRR